MFRIISQPTRLDMALLGLVLEEPRSGYDLRKVFASTPMGPYSDSPGAIYPALRRLERLRLVTGKVDRSRSLRPRRLFRTTAAGRDVLAEWVSRPVTREDVARREEELMLRFAFMDVLVDQQSIQRFLEQMIAEIDSYLKELIEHRNGMTGPGEAHGRLALEGGIEGYRARARWARRAHKLLASEALLVEDAASG